MNLIDTSVGIGIGLSVSHYGEKILDKLDASVVKTVRKSAHTVVSRMDATDAKRKSVPFEVVVAVVMLAVLMVKLQVKPPLLLVVAVGASVYTARAWMKIRASVHWAATTLARS